MDSTDSAPMPKAYALSAPTAVTAGRRRGTFAVSFLTRFKAIRRLFDGSRRLPRNIVVTILLLGVGPLAAAAPNGAWHSIKDIEKKAEVFVRDAVAATGQRVTPQVSRLDRRLRLPQCTRELEAFQQSGTKIASRTVIGVRCTGERPWRVYVPIDVIVTDSVLVARLPLPGGHILTTDDVIAEKRDVSRLVSGYVTDTANLLGKRLKHALMAGRVITPSMLKAGIMIRRGQTVTILANHDGVSIRMAGLALSDGSKDQRIRVENTNSKRVIEGIVRSAEHVEVLVY